MLMDTARQFTANRIKEARTRRLAMTQQELAVELGVSVVVVSRWERNATEPRPSNVRALATLAGLPVSWFYDEAAA